MLSGAFGQRLWLSAPDSGGAGPRKQTPAATIAAKLEALRFGVSLGGQGIRFKDPGFGVLDFRLGLRWESFIKHIRKRQLCLRIVESSTLEPVINSKSTKALNLNRTVDAINAIT